jgi:hypothetical protein
LNRMIGVVMDIIGIAVILIFFPMLTTGVHDVQTEQVTQTYAGIVTTTGTTGTVTMTDEVFNDRINQVTLSGGTTGDTMVATSLSADGKTLVVGGLATSATRGITVEYSTDALGDYTGLGTFVGLVPLLAMLAGIGTLIFGAYKTIKG